MRQLLAGVFLQVLSLVPMSLSAAPAPDFPLAPGAPGEPRRFHDLGSNWRKLIVFAPEGRALGIAGMKWNAVRSRLADPEFAKGLAGRDVFVVLVAREVVALAPGVKSARVPEEAIPSTRTAYGFGEGSGVTVLVGKDGGIKETWTGHLDPAAVFAAIDAMPQRQAETRER